MELVDCHTHSTYSDGASSIAHNVARAAELGIATLCCTDHLTLPSSLDPTCEVSVAEADLPVLARDVAQAAAAYPQVEVVFGFEADYYPGCEHNVMRWRQSATFLLGSVHGVDGRWIDDLRDLSYWDEHGTEATWRRYFEVWCEACGSDCRFDSMAHPDLVMLLGRFPDDAVRARLYAQAAEAAREAGVRVEINTAGLLKPAGRMYPHDELLRLFWRAGVALTVGSDAHDARRVGENVERAYALAWECGYRSVDVPTSDGGWRTLDIRPH